MLNGVFISGSIEKQKTFHSSKIPQIIGVTKYMKEFFDDNNYKYSSKDITLDDLEWKEYECLLNEYNQQHGCVFTRRLKRLVIKLSSCVVPGRKNRSNWRNFLKKILK